MDKASPFLAGIAIVACVYNSYEELLWRGTDQKIAFTLGLYEFMNAFFLFQKKSGFKKTGSAAVPSQFRDPGFKVLWIGAILFLGCTRLTFAFASDKGSCCSWQTPWFTHWLCHVIETGMWYTMALQRTGKTLGTLFFEALVFRGKSDETTGNFILLVLLPLLTVYFYVAGGTHVEWKV